MPRSLTCLLLASAVLSTHPLSAATPGNVAATAFSVAPDGSARLSADAPPPQKTSRRRARRAAWRRESTSNRRNALRTLDDGHEHMGHKRKRPPINTNNVGGPRKQNINTNNVGGPRKVGRGRP